MSSLRALHDAATNMEICAENIRAFLLPRRNAPCQSDNEILLCIEEFYDDVAAIFYHLQDGTSDDRERARSNRDT